MNAENDPYCQPLIGLRLSSVEKKDYSWFFRFVGGASIATESAWRLISEERIIVTSEDHGHQFGLPEPVNAADIALSSVAGCTVEAASISASSADLTIEFSGRLRLQFLQVSSGYESWRLSFPGGETICIGGGGIAHFPRR